MQKYSAETWELGVKIGWSKKRSQVGSDCGGVLAPNSDSEITSHLLEMASERLWSVMGSSESKNPEREQLPQDGEDAEM